MRLLHMLDLCAQHCTLSRARTQVTDAFSMQLLGEDGAAYKGNLDEVQRLFRTGEVSVTDCDDEDDMTALW